MQYGNMILRVRLISRHDRDITVSYTHLDVYKRQDGLHLFVCVLTTIQHIFSLLFI